MLVTSSLPLSLPPSLFTLELVLSLALAAGAVVRIGKVAVGAIEELGREREREGGREGGREEGGREGGRREGWE